MKMVFYSYIISPKNIKEGEKLSSGENAEIKNGNCLPIKKYSSWHKYS